MNRVKWSFLAPVLWLSIFASASVSYADECKRGLGRYERMSVCGGACRLDRDGSVICSPSTGLPGQCLSDRWGNQHCGGACGGNRDGTVTCSSRRRPPNPTPAPAPTPAPITEFSYFWDTNSDGIRVCRQRNPVLNGIFTVSDFYCEDRSSERVYTYEWDSTNRNCRAYIDGSFSYIAQNFYCPGHETDE